MPLEMIFTIIATSPLLIVVYHMIYDEIIEDMIRARKRKEQQQLEARTSPYTHGYRAFDLAQRQPGSQSFVLELLENPMYHNIVQGEKKYKIRDIMQEVMVIYNDQWRYYNIFPHKNNEDEEQFWLGARDAILDYLKKDINSQQTRKNSLQRAEERQKIIDNLHTKP